MMTLDVKPEIAAALSALADAHGVSVEEYLEQLLARELPSGSTEPADVGSGMVWEGGLFVYRTGKPLPQHIVDEAVRLGRAERSLHILGNRS